MKKTVFSVLAVSSLLMAAESQETLKEEIKAVKTKIKELELDLKKLKAQLPPNEAFVTHTEFGFMDTQGNTRTQTFGLDASAKKGWGKNSINMTLDAQYATNEGVEIKNKYTTELGYDYDITDKLSFGYLAGFKQDEFSGYQHQFYTGPSAKYKAVKTQMHKLSLEANILYAQDKLDGMEDTEDYASYRTKAVYGWQVLDNLKFDQDLSYRSAFDKSDNYFVFSKSAFTSKISNVFSAGLSYKVDYTNLVAAGKDYTDRTLTANLIMDY
ncbi:DUF481 domain-containing protein [bacterium]|nr:DUF481 domain-containing protein [bacterium]MBU1989905.1 DUF481 domain-containing protein [bacterium]